VADPSRIHISNLIYSIHRTFILVGGSKLLPKQGFSFGSTIAHRAVSLEPRDTMPQEISVSYQAIKSKIYRLIDALVVGEKNEAEVQESIRRWWSLIHPADRPIAQKYLLTVLGRSCSALDAVGDAMLSVGSSDPVHAQIHSELSTRRMRLVERLVKDVGMRQAV
jgi:hypothetical protein